MTNGGQFFHNLLSGQLLILVGSQTQRFGNKMNVIGSKRIESEQDGFLFTLDSNWITISKKNERRKKLVSRKERERKIRKGQI